MDTLLAMCIFAAAQTRIDIARREGIDETCSKCCGQMSFRADGPKIKLKCSWCNERKEL